MNILVSEDDDYKFNKIEKDLLNDFVDAKIHREKTVRGTLDCLHLNYVDMLVQDMGLPYFDESHSYINSKAGLDVVFSVNYEEIDIKSKYVCSYDKDVEIEFLDELNECGFVFVHFDPSCSMSGKFKIQEKA